MKQITQSYAQYTYMQKLQNILENYFSIDLFSDMGNMIFYLHASMLVVISFDLLQTKMGLYQRFHLKFLS